MRLRLDSPTARAAARSLLGIVFAIASCRAPESPPILLISIDTLRSDRLPAYGFTGLETPAIDRLRHDGLLFERAYSHVPLTLPSHASMLTGTLPPEHGVRDNLGYELAASGPRTLAERLRERGYATGGSVSAQVLAKRTGIARGFDFWDEPKLVSTAIDETVERQGAASLKSILGWLEDNREKPFFLFLHLYEPHFPWNPPEPFLGRHGATYEGEIAAADAVVGELIAQLDRLGLYDRCVIALTSDHGEGLGDHGELEHGILLYREALQVPLVLKLPGGARRSEAVAEPVQSIDLAPTLLALAGAAGQGLGGRDLTSRALAPATTYAETYYPQLHFGWSELRAAIAGRWHLIEGPSPSFELYDLVGDPREREDVFEKERRAAADLRGYLNGFDKRLAPPREEDEETAKALGALGYLGSTAPAGSGPRPHPREMVRKISDFLRGKELLRERRFEEAEPLLRNAVALEPRRGAAWHALGEVLDQLGRRAEAAEALAKAAELSPLAGKPELGSALRLLEVKRPKPALDFVRAQLARTPGDPLLHVVESRALLQLGRREEAFAAIERAIALDPDSADAHYQLGVIGMAERRADIAGPAFERAIALDSRHVAAMKALATLEFALDHPDRARQLLERVLALLPADTDAREGLALLDRRAGSRP